MNTIQAGNFNEYNSLSNFETLEAFNEHYRKLTYTFAEILEQKPSFKAVLKSLFELGAKTRGVAFIRRSELADKAKVSTRSLDNFIKAADTFGITILKALGSKKDSNGKVVRFGGYAHNVYVFGNLSDLCELPSDKPCEASCKPSLQTVEAPETQQQQAIEASFELPNQDSFKQDSPSELKDIKYIVQEDTHKESFETVYKESKTFSPFDRDIDMLLSGFEIEDKIKLHKAIEKTLAKRNLLFVDYKLSVLNSLETLKYFKKQESQGKFVFKKGEIAFLVYNLNNEIDKEIESTELADYDASMKESALNGTLVEVDELFSFDSLPQHLKASVKRASASPSYAMPIEEFADRDWMNDNGVY